MSFRVERNYLAIPCTITYTVYDSSMTFIMSETITNPPGPPPPPCFGGIPAFVEINVNGVIFIIQVDCNTVTQIWIPCPAPGFHPFRACYGPDPLGSCGNLLTLDL